MRSNLVTHSHNSEYVYEATQALNRMQYYVNNKNCIKLRTDLVETMDKTLCCLHLIKLTLS